MRDVAATVIHHDGAARSTATSAMRIVAATAMRSGRGGWRCRARMVDDGSLKIQRAAMVTGIPVARLRHDDGIEGRSSCQEGRLGGVFLMTRCAFQTLDRGKKGNNNPRCAAAARLLEFGDEGRSA